MKDFSILQARWLWCLHVVTWSIKLLSMWDVIVIFHGSRAICFHLQQHQTRETNKLCSHSKVENVKDTPRTCCFLRVFRTFKRNALRGGARHTPVCLIFLRFLWIFKTKTASHNQRMGFYDCKKKKDSVYPKTHPVSDGWMIITVLLPYFQETPHHHCFPHKHLRGFRNPSPFL